MLQPPPTADKTYYSDLLSPTSAANAALLASAVHQQRNNEMAARSGSPTYTHLTGELLNTVYSHILDYSPFVPCSYPGRPDTRITHASSRCSPQWLPSGRRRCRVRCDDADLANGARTLRRRDRSVRAGANGHVGQLPCNAATTATANVQRECHGCRACTPPTAATTVDISVQRVPLSRTPVTHVSSRVSMCVYNPRFASIVTIIRSNKPPLQNTRCSEVQQQSQNPFPQLHPRARAPPEKAPP
jgi:hypothetical protein